MTTTTEKWCADSKKELSRVAERMGVVILQTEYCGRDVFMENKHTWRVTHRTKEESA